MRGEEVYMRIVSHRYLFLATFLVLTALCFSGCPGISQAVFFKDAALENKIRYDLGKPLGLLTQRDLLQVKTLIASELGIKDLRGLEYCLNLRVLDLSNNSISDLSPLKGVENKLLENLVWLDLDTNNILNIEPLASLKNLSFLNIDSNQLTDISPLSGLLNLKGLSLFDNQVGDISALVTNVEVGGLLDYVILDEKTMSEQALTVDIPRLQALGVNVILVTATS